MKKGFTMIELLVVIAVIGILAVALLATLNPLEQIRKGRDTRTRSDASQLASALERYNASLGRFPWQASEGQVVMVDFRAVKSGSIPASNGCTLTVCDFHNAAGTGILDQLTQTNEVKTSFIDRIAGTSSRDLYLYYNSGNTGASVTVCFMPESNTFAREAFDRCKSGNFGTDFLKGYGVNAGQTATTATVACPDAASQGGYSSLEFNASDADELICLP